MAVRFKLIREKSDLTQEKVANILGISKSNYNYFENEERFIPLKHLNNYCDYFNVSMDYVFNLSSLSINHKSSFKLDPVLVGRRIRKIRKLNNLTQKQLASLVNTSQSTISSYEKGNTLIITAFLYGLCRCLNVSMDYITGRSNVIKIFHSDN